MTRKCVKTAHTHIHTGKCSLEATTAVAGISNGSLRHFKQQHNGCRGNETFALFACQIQCDSEMFFFSPVRDFFLFMSVNNTLCNFLCSSHFGFRVNANFFFSVDLCFEYWQILVRRRRKKKKRIRGIFLLRSGMCSIVCNVYIISLRQTPFTYKLISAHFTGDHFM